MITITDLYKKQIDFREPSFEDDDWGRPYYNKEGTFVLRLNRKNDSAMITFTGYTFITKVPTIDLVRGLVLDDIEQAISSVFNLIKDQLTIDLMANLILTTADLSFDEGYQKAKSDVRDFLLSDKQGS